MPAGQTVLLVGGTGRMGRRVLTQLLERGVSVRAIVRSARRLPQGIADHPRLTVVEADLLSLGGADLGALVRGCHAVISCLGHVISVQGVLGPPHDLVTRATARLCQAIRDSQPVAPVKFILMSSVSVNHPGAAEARRGELGAGNPFVQWVAVRPDTLLEGDASAYSLHENLVRSLFQPGSTHRANVAQFMCDLATDAETWDRWAGRLPVIVNGSSPHG